MTLKEQKILAALLSSRTKQEAAQVAGVGLATLYRYLGNEQFLAEYNRRRDEVTSAAAAQLQRTCSQAIQTLEQVLESGSDGVRVSAARTILEYGLKYTEQSEVLQRIERLERMMEDGRSKAAQ